MSVSRRAWLFVFLASSAWAQDDWLTQRVREEEAVLEKLAEHSGQRLSLAGRSPVTRFIRDYMLAPADATEVQVTDELLEKAIAVHRFKVRDYYAPGTMVFLNRDGVIMSGIVEWAKRDSVRVRWQDRAGQEHVESMTREDLHELNAPRFARPGEPVRFFDVSIDPANDELIQPMLQKARKIVDVLMPEFVEALRRGDMAEAARAQMLVIQEIYEHAMIDGEYFSGYWSDPAYQEWLSHNGGVVTAGRAWVDRKGVCHTRAGVLFSALQPELMERMGAALQLHRGKTSGEGIFHTWVSTRLANGVWVYDAPTWAQGDMARGFEPNIEHIYGQFNLFGQQWGIARVIDGMSGTLLAVPPANPKGYTKRFVEILTRIKGKAGTRELLKRMNVRTPQQERASEVGLRQKVREEAAGMAKFAAAYVLKEGIKALETGDGKALKQTVQSVGSVGFWKDMTVFTVASRVVEKSIRGVGRSFVPLAVGMAAVDAINGRLHPREIAVSTASFVVAGMAINAIADTIVYSTLWAAGPPGWIGMGLYTVGKLAATLYFGEKIENGIDAAFGWNKK